MSQQVQIDYKQIAVQCNSVCEIAEVRLQEFESLISQLDHTSQSLLNEETKRLSEQLIAEKNLLIKKINEVRKKADEEARMGTVHTNNHDARYAHINDTINAAEALKQTANDTASKFIEYQTLLTSLMHSSLSNGYNELFSKGSSNVEAIRKELDLINDEILRQFAIIAYLKDNSLRGVDLINAAKKIQGESYESRLESESQRIRKELEESRIATETIDKVLSATGTTAQETLASIRESATTEIVGEKVRQKSLKMIMQAIKERGFIVDKNSIKLKKDTNEVVMIAQKASGEKAEFKVFLDGKFIYDFHGYEGQACQKDIEPFLSDLEEVYGIHITKSQEIWSNPDKISSMKYQSINTNKNKR